MQYEVILNPTAGSGKAEKTWEKLQPLFDNQLTYHLYKTDYAKHEEYFAKKISQSYNNTPNVVIIVVGGDGTLHNVLNSLKQNDSTIPLSYIPSGTGNDFARGYGINLSPEKALQQILAAERARTITIGHYTENIKNEDGYFLNNIGIGFDAAIVSRVNNSSAKKNLNKAHVGRLSYFFKALGVIYDQQPFSLMVRENGHHQLFSKAFIAISTNEPYIGSGFKIDPLASVDENAINIVIAERRNWLITLWQLLQLARGKLANSKFAHTFHTNKIHYSTTSLEFGQVDGENMGNRFYDLTIDTSSYEFWQTSENILKKN